MSTYSANSFLSISLYLAKLFVAKQARLQQIDHSRRDNTLDFFDYSYYSTSVELSPIDASQVFPFLLAFKGDK